MFAVGRSPVSMQGRCSRTKAQPGLGPRQGHSWVEWEDRLIGTMETKRVLLYIKGKTFMRTAIQDYVNRSVGMGEYEPDVRGYPKIALRVGGGNLQTRKLVPESSVEHRDACLFHAGQHWLKFWPCKRADSLAPSFRSNACCLFFSFCQVSLGTTFCLWDLCEKAI